MFWLHDRVLIAVARPDTGNTMHDFSRQNRGNLDFSLDPAYHDIGKKPVSLQILNLEQLEN